MYNFFSKINISIILLLLLFSIQINCTTEVIENTIHKTIPVNVTDKKDDEEIDPNIIPEINPNADDEVGIEFGNPAPIPNPSEDLDGIEFGNPDSGFDGIEFGNPHPKVQKGPYVMDSKVEIQELTPTFGLNGRVYLLSVEDHLGSFSLPNNLQSFLIEVKGTGFYFNEITGMISGAPITLGSYSSLEDRIAPNINILTTLAQKRIKYLVLEEEKIFVKAEEQAKNEVMRAFRIPDEDIKNFDELSIMGNENGDAILLAISVILQGNLLEGELTNFISNIREDIRDNGQIDSQEIYDQICRQTQSLNPIQIRENLIQFYERINVEDYNIPFFEDYLDHDCDGIINKNDVESLITSLRYQSDFFNLNYRMSIQDFNDQVWIYNVAKYIENDSTYINNGLYSSDDLNTWERNQLEVSSGMPYEGDIFDVPLNKSHFFTYDNQLWTYGGYANDRNDTFSVWSFIFSNNFHAINRDHEVLNLISGLRFRHEDLVFYESFFEFNYFNENIRENLSQLFDGTNCLFFGECDTLGFQESHYKSDQFDSFQRDSIRNLIDISSQWCQKVFIGEDDLLLKVDLLNRNNMCDRESISFLNDDYNWEFYTNYHEKFYHFYKFEIDRSPWTCEIFRTDNIDYNFDEALCLVQEFDDCQDGRQDSRECRNLSNQCRDIRDMCMHIHAVNGLENYDNLYYLTEIQDITYFQNNYYIIANDSRDHRWYLYKMPHLHNSANIEVIFDLTYLDEDARKKELINQFYIYEDQLFIFNAYDAYKGNLIYSTSDGIGWNINEIDYYNQYIDITYNVSGYTGIHNPFLFKNFIHRPFRENKMSVIGKYKYYKDYLNFYFDKIE